MEFLSFRFLILFFVAVTAAYHCETKYRNFWLLVCSLFFYFVSCSKYFWLLVLLIVLTYTLGILISRFRHKSTYILSALCVLSLLAFFKYSDFIVHTIHGFAFPGNGSEPIRFGLDLILPLGISFMTFQAISYLGDIYFGKICVEKNFINVALFISYFPTVVSGPIQKAKDFLPEIKKKTTFHCNQAVHGVFLFTFGALQKFYISDRLHPIADTMLGSIETYTGFQYVFFAVLYSVYIYTNFNSYSDMAIGLSNILGINLSQNFKRPYLSKSIKEFWQRWHISLNSWFVDYIYIPLGGSRKGRARYFANIVIVFALSGLWHGAGFHFILWGLLNAAYQIIGNLTYQQRARLYDKLKINTDAAVIVWMKRLVVFGLISVSWLFFAIPDSGVAWKAVGSMFKLTPASFIAIKEILKASGIISLAPIASIFTAILLFAVIQTIREKYSIGHAIRTLPGFVKNAIYVTATVFILLGYFSSFTGYGNGGFIYGNF